MLLMPASTTSIDFVKAQAYIIQLIIISSSPHLGLAEPQSIYITLVATLYTLHAWVGYTPCIHLYTLPKKEIWSPVYTCIPTCIHLSTHLYTTRACSKLYTLWGTPLHNTHVGVLELVCHILILSIIFVQHRRLL